jgi:pyruvate/2-oxoglutarate/acetoin dehydrogenase E1 component
MAPVVLLRKNGERLMKQEDLHAQVTEALYARIPG